MATKAESALTIVLAATFLLSASAQTKSADQYTPAEILVQRATALDNQGRHDLAAETWNQVLSVNPKDPQALAALATYYRSVGDTVTAKRYLDQLRQANPSDPRLNQLQTGRTYSGDDSTLREAARLSAQHRYAEALTLYRQAFHGALPTGSWAVAYYETEAAIPSEMPQAVAGLRSLVRQFPANTSYALSLGRVLTYRTETRLEGVRILQGIKGTAAQMNAARDAWRQAILWDPSGPAATETGEQFVARFNDTDVANALRNAPAHQPKRLVVEGEAEQGEAYAALSKGDLDAAEKQFTALTKIQPQRAKAYMGLGYVAMQRQQFGVAIQNYELAGQAGLHNSELTDAMNEARFWGSMQKGEQALVAHNDSEALTRFQYASELRPRDPAVLDALGRTWIQMKQPEKAIPLFEQAVKLNEDRPDAWIDWFGALAQTGRSREIVADQPYIPSAVSTQLATNPEYIAILAVSELETGNEESFRQLLEQLHSFTDTTKRVNGQLRLASLILNSNPRDAAREALDIIRLSPDNIEAWKLVVIAEHLANRDTMAQTAIDRMPQQVYAAAQKDTNFAITLAAVQQSLHHYGDATDVLESARARAAEDPVALRTIDSQLASLSLQQGDPNKAAQGYSAIVQEQPDNSDAWAGLISALHQSNQDRLARAQMDLMPPSVAEHLQLDPGYLQVAASVYTETHELQRALTALATVRNYYRDREQQIPYSVEAQRAWALIAIGDDNDVANTLVQLSHRSDLKPVEQRQNRMLWAAWSVRKALQEEKHGNPQRAIAILEMASQAYPDSVDIRRALAGTYVRTGNAKSALALYEGIDWYSAGKEDFLGAISAASASRDFTQGRQWVANALEHFPDDPQVLTAAAEFESSAGDMRMAKQYWHDVLNVPAQKLEQQLSQSSNGSSSISASDALARMLAPHVRSGDESASEAAAPPPSGSSDETDDVMAMLPASGGATSSRAIVPDTPPSGQSSQQNASPWLVEKARSKGASYQPMAYSDESAAPSHGEQSAWRPASDQSVPAPLAPASSYVSPRPSSRVTADRSVYNDELPAVTQPAPLPAQAPERAALLRTVALQNQIPQSGADSGHGWSSSQSSSDAASSFTGYSTAGASQQFANADSSAPQAGPPNNFLIRTNPDARRASDELQNLSSELSPWVGGSVRIVGRSGSPGFDQLTRSEIGIEGSSVLGDSARVTVITKPTFLTSGTPVANSEGVLNTPYNFGQSGAPLLNQPHFQSGVGGELQIATPFLSGSVGFTPSTFYVSNKLGSVDLHPERTPFHLGVFRESITETMLSYAGERDPVTGAIWGGVVATGAEGGISKGTVQSGFYTDFSAAKITGLNVNENQRLEGSTGAYWTFFTNAYGALKIGANVSGEHFDQNQRYFTYGQGGYFSPDTYLLINAPFTWTGRSNRLAYTISGSLGMQSFNEDPALAGSISTNAPTAQTVIGANYSLSGNFAYKLDEHWYIGTFFNVNNTSNYQERSAGFSVRYMKLPQVQSLIGPTGLFDNQAPRPLIIP